MDPNLQAIIDEIFGKDNENAETATRLLASLGAETPQDAAHITEADLLDAGIPPSLADAFLAKVRGWPLDNANHPPPPSEEAAGLTIARQTQDVRNIAVANGPPIWDDGSRRDLQAALDKRAILTHAGTGQASLTDKQKAELAAFQKKCFSGKR